MGTLFYFALMVFGFLCGWYCKGKKDELMKKNG